MPGIKIDRLEIRLKGVAARKVRPAAEVLGETLLGRIAADPSPLGSTAVAHADRIDAGGLRISGQVDSARLGRMMADQVMEAVLSRMRK